jgi:hypothetical protein
VSNPKLKDAPLEVELTRLARKYSTWMYPNDFAAEERCSVDTARRRLVAGDYGSPVDQLPGGSYRLLTATYCQTLRNRALDIKTA